MFGLPRALRARAALSFAATSLLVTVVAPRADAQALVFITGVVTEHGKPAPGARISLAGNNLVSRAVADAQGRYRFAAASGEYTVTATLGKLSVRRSIVVTAGGATVELPLDEALAVIGRTVVSHPSVDRASGTDVAIGSERLDKLPDQTSLSNILVTLPDAARGSNGQIHVNGDHNGLNYFIDGVEIPTELNRVLGNEVDPADIQSIDVLEGAYPAQYGDHFAAQLNIATKARTGPPGFDETIRYGSYSTVDETLDAHVPVGNGGSFTVAGRLSRDGRALDPATQNAPHDSGSVANAFARLSMPLGKNDSLNLDLLHSTQTFQIPPDTDSGFPASQDDNEISNDNFASLQFRHNFSANTSVAFGPAYKNSLLLDTPDQAADLAGAAGTTCTDFSDCNFYSVYANRVSQDTRFTLDAVTSGQRHEVRAGIIVTRDSLPKLYAITLQAGNQLSPTGAPFTVTDDSLNRASQQEAYLQDSWTVVPHLRLDAGVRYDALSISSNDFADAYRQFSPRVKLTRDFGSRANVYAYYGRLFTPFSFENVDPAAAAALFALSNAPGAQYDLKPQRDSLYEAGGHLPIGAADVGVRISHKVSTDYLDDTQVGPTNLHQDINFPQGRIDSQSVYASTALPLNGRFFVGVSHVTAVNSANCETQLLQNCALGGPPGGDFRQSDHDQHYDVTTGAILNDRHGDYFSVTGEYGSGLSRGDTSVCPDADAVNCKVPPHLTFDVAQAYKLAPNTFVTGGITNLFDDDYAVTLNSSLQGTHYARPRTFFVRFDVGH